MGPEFQVEGFFAHFASVAGSGTNSSQINSLINWPKSHSRHGQGIYAFRFRQFRPNVGGEIS